MTTTVQPLRPYALFTDNTGRLTTEGYDFLYNIFLRVGGSLSNLNAVTLLTYDWNSPGTIGATVPNTGKFTTVQSTIATGTAPFIVASTTRVANLNATTAGNSDTVTTNANLTGSVTSVGNATTVVTNANLTGVITSSGNATSIASQTGTGTKFVVDTSPTLITPNIGVASGTSITVTGGFGCNTKTAQTAFVSGGAAPAGGTGATAGAWDTAAHRDAAITLLNNIRSALVANGIMS